MNKLGIWAIAIVVAFVVGSIVTGTTALAAPPEEKALVLAIQVGLQAIVDAINGVNPTVNVDPTPITVNAPQGEKGDKGDKGATGDTGAKGDTGADGVIPKVYTNSGRAAGTTAVAS